MKGISCGVGIGFGLLWSPPECVACQCQQDLGNSVLLPGAAAAREATSCSCLVGSRSIFFCLSPCLSHKCCSVTLYLLSTQFCSLGARVELHLLQIRLVLSFMLMGMCCSRSHRVSLFVCACKPHQPFDSKIQYKNSVKIQ